jgi:hypothetical protein
MKSRHKKLLDQVRDRLLLKNYAYQCEVSSAGERQGGRARFHCQPEPLPTNAPRTLRAKLCPLRALLAHLLRRKP